MSGLFLFTASFLGAAVELVETLTIVLAVGITRGWRSALLGASAGAVVLLLLTLMLGQALTQVISLDALRIIIGGLLLIFGLQWLRKAILRYAGLKALHDEDRIYAEDVEELKLQSYAAGPVDWLGFTVAFKGVLLEGLEVVFIVLTFGSSAGEDAGFAGLNGVWLASLGAGLACIVVIIAGLLVHRPLARVPENDMKFAVGLMLASFGTFWAGEGVGIVWVWDDATVLVLLAIYGILSWAAVAVLRRNVIRRVTA